MHIKLLTINLPRPDIKLYFGKVLFDDKKYKIKCKIILTLTGKEGNMLLFYSYYRVFSMWYPACMGICIST